MVAICCILVQCVDDMQCTLQGMLRADVGGLILLFQTLVTTLTVYFSDSGVLYLTNVVVILDCRVVVMTSWAISADCPSCILAETISNNRVVSCYEPRASTPFLSGEPSSSLTSQKPRVGSKGSQTPNNIRRPTAPAGIFHLSIFQEEKRCIFFSFCSSPYFIN